MPLKVLSVAFPLTPVGPDTAGGAEQIVAHLDAAFERIGHRSIVVACEGSRVHGKLVPSPGWDGDLSYEVRRWAQQQHRIAIDSALARHDVDIIHMHGLDWHTYLAPGGPPVLATLHLPPAWYPPEVFHIARPRTHLNCVSRSELRDCPSAALPVHLVENGVPVDRLFSHVRRRNYVVSLGRICPEKGFHIALDAARRADLSMLLAGEVFRYESHRKYYVQEILPRLDERRKFVRSIGLARKRRLLTGARCLLAPSLAAETSSLVAMEALACGTPVIGFPSGALPEVIEHGRTGFIVHDELEMAEAIRAVSMIDRDECRQVARTRFSAERMARDYLRLYQRMLRNDEIGDSCSPAGVGRTGQPGA